MSVVPLEEALAESQFGGKASALARAIAAGLPVPGGFAISSDLVARIAASDAESEPSALAFFEAAGKPLAVRSSGIGEDSADASFAGQHETILNVTTAPAFLDAVRAVHASSQHAAAVSYRERLGISGPARIGVVVQRMVRPDTAGVLFTRNPLTGADERVIEASWGLGESVVAGLVVPDRFRVARGGAVLERTAGVKDIEIVMLDGGTTEEVPVEEERARRLTLSDKQLAALDRLASRCEEVFGGPQDLEWAFEGATLHLLQARPITRSVASAPPAAAAKSEDESYELAPARFAGLALAAILSPLNSTSIAVALPAIGTSLAADAASVTRWLVTSYLIISIIAQSPGGKLSDSWGYSRVLTWGRILFGAGALISAFAPHLAILGFGRIVMAAGGSLTIPTVMAELRNNTPPSRRGRLFGLFGAIMGTAAATGPLVGGLLVTHFGWHSIFIVNLPVVALSLILEPPHRDPARQRKASFDLLGAVLFGAGILAILGGLQKPLHPLLALGGVAILAVFIARESRAADPMLDVRLFALRPFAAGSSIVALQNLAMYATLFLLPFMLVRERHASATGSAMMAMIVAMVLASPLGGRMTDRIGARATALAGGVVAFSGALLLYTSRVGLTPHTIGALILLGLGLGLSTSPSQAAALSAVPREKAGMASGAMSTMRYLGGVVGSAIIAGLLAQSGWRSQWFAWIFPPVLLASALVALLLPAREGLAHEPVNVVEDAH